MTVPRPLVLLAVLAASPAVAQAPAGLRIHAAVTADAPGDTDGMERRAVVTAPDREVWVGGVVLDLPPASVQTVGLERDAAGDAALSLWLSDDAGRAFAALTEASVGRALAVVYDGRVLTAPVVRSAIPNGLVMITGLDGAEAERIADALRAASAPPGATPASAAPPRRPPLAVPPPEGAAPRGTGAPAPQRPPLAVPLPDGATDRAPTGRPAPAAANPAAASARAAALAFVDAVAGRDWRAAADGLHPDALRAVRPAASGVLRLDGAAVRVVDGDRRGDLDAAALLGARPSVRSLDDLPDRDLATLYLAALDVLGVWGPPGGARTVVGEVRDGDRLHVLMRGADDAPGVSAVTVVTLAPDRRGAWRPLLTQPQGF